jgi:hypothetical protein
MSRIMRIAGVIKFNCSTEVIYAAPRHSAKRPTLSITTFSITTLNIKSLFATLSMNDTQHNSKSAIRHKVECRDLFIVVLNIIMLSVVMLHCYSAESIYAERHDLFIVMLNVIMLSVIMLVVVMLSVAAPIYLHLLLLLQMEKKTFCIHSPFLFQLSVWKPLQHIK